MACNETQRKEAMFTIKREQDPLNTRIETLIDDLLDRISKEPNYTENYESMVKQVTKLIELRDKPDQISKDAMLTVGTHVLGLLLILGHERAGIIASKGFGLLKRIV